MEKAFSWHPISSRAFQLRNSKKEIVGVIVASEIRGWIAYTGDWADGIFIDEIAARESLLNHLNMV